MEPHLGVFIRERERLGQAAVTDMGEARDVIVSRDHTFGTMFSDQKMYQRVSPGQDPCASPGQNSSVSPGHDYFLWPPLPTYRG